MIGNAGFSRHGSSLFRGPSVKWNGSTGDRGLTSRMTHSHGKAVMAARDLGSPPYTPLHGPLVLLAAWLPVLRTSTPRDSGGSCKVLLT